MGTAYKWKTGFYKTDAETAGKVFEELSNTVGLTPQNLVDASRPEEAPLHNEFLWDDEVAAEEWRKQQARLMICNLAIEIEEEKTPPVRAFFHSVDEKKYEDIRVIMSDEDKKEKLFKKAMAELNSFRMKYANLEVFASLFAEIDRLEKRE